MNHQYLYGQNCTSVESTDVQVTLRNLISVHSDADSVTITTEYSGNSPEGRAEVILSIRHYQTVQFSADLALCTSVAAKR